MRVPYDGIHYDINTMLSYNALFNIICSTRGLGKTFSFKDYAIDDALKDNQHKKFIYLRRYEKELKKLNTFFKDIESYYPDVEFKVKGGENGGTFFANDKEIGYFCCLTRQSYLKSVPMNDCNKLIFDEAFLKRRSYIRYLPDELFDLMDLVETANRLRINEDGTQKKLSEQLRVFLLANAFSVVNPYFNGLQITPDTTSRFSFSRNPNLKKLVLLDICSSDEFKKLKNESDWGIIQREIGYAQHAIDNEFFEDDDNLIGFNPKLQKCISLTDGIHTIYAYPDYKNGIVYMSNKAGQIIYKYNCNASKLAEGEKLIKTYKKTSFEIFYDWLSYGAMFFKDIESKDTALILLNKIGMGNR